MDLDESPRPKADRGDDVLGQLVGQDLDPLSQDELAARIAALEGEIARTRARLARAADQRASADALFRS